jgi:hypothetical protein
MTVIQKEILAGEKLLKLVPDNVYVRDTPYTQRVVTRINSTNQSGISTTFPSSTILQYSVNPTDNNLINLDESYFSIAGELRFYDENDAVLKNDLKANPEKYLIIPPYWYINSFLTLNLYIGGTLVRSVNNPMMLVNFYTSHYKSFTDRQNGNLEERGFYPIPSIVSYDFSTNENPNTLKHVNDTKYILTSYTDDDTVSVTTPYPYNIQFYKNTDGGEDYATFQQIIYLNDLFPEVSTIKPLFGSSVLIEIKLEGDGFTSIRGTDVSDLAYAKIHNFKQFNFNVVSYTLDSPMKQKLKEIYSKEIISIIDSISYFPSSLQNIGDNSQFSLAVPLNLEFASDLINISIPQSTGNNFKLYTDWDKTYLYLNHTKFDNRLYPIRNISVFCDGTLLYSRDYATSNIELHKYAVKCNPLINSLDSANQSGGFELYDYTILYKEYLESRYTTYENEHNGIPIDEWINNYFSINIPTSAFTTLSTQQNIILQINFGSGIDNGTQYSISRLNTSANANEFLTQIKVIQKSKKALVFKGWNTCEIRTITQSFSNDISLDNLNDNQINN